MFPPSPSDSNEAFGSIVTYTSIISPNKLWSNETDPLTYFVKLTSVILNMKSYVPEFSYESVLKIYL